MRLFISVFLLLLSSISGFAQIPKGYYFTDIKGTTWLSSENSMDSTLVDFAEMSLLRHDMHATDTLSKNVWIFSDSLTIQFYDAASRQYKNILSCVYDNNEKDHTLLLQLNSERKITFQYTPVSTGNFIYLHKKKKK